MKPVTKVTLIFATTIIIPAVSLSYFGLRAIENDRLVMEKRIENNCLGIANVVINEVNRAFAGTEEKLRKILSPKFVQPEAFRETEARIKELQEEEGLIEQIFVLNGNGEVIYPISLFPTALRTREAEPEKNAEDKQIFHDYYRRGQTSEFIENDYRKAISSYREIILDVPDKGYQAVALNAIGRGYLKLKEYGQARESYQELADKYPHSKDLNGLPLGAVAGYQKGMAYKYLGEKRNFLESLLHLYQQLVNNEWGLDKTQYTYFKKKVLPLLKGILEEDYPVLRARWEGLKRIDAERERIESFLLTFREIALSKLKEMLSGTDEYSSSFGYLIKSADGEPYLLYTFIPDEGGKKKVGLAGFKFDPSYARSVLGERIANLNLGEEVIIALLDDQGQIIGATDEPGERKPVIVKSLEESLPFWKVAIYERHPEILQKLARRRTTLYIGMIAVLTSAIIMGTYLTWRAVSQELQLARMKSDFVSNVSHELKTPLTSIRMFAEMLQTGRVPDEKKRREYHDIIANESERLTHLINNVLDFSRIEEGRKKYEFKLHNLGQVVKETVELFRLHLMKKGYEVKVEVSDNLPRIMIDKDSISQALLNLLGNAVKYSPDQKEIKVNLRKVGQESIIEVIDKGIGIPESEREKIFDKFYRITQKQTPEAGGSGLGLTLVEYTAEAHGGRVEVEGQEGKGSKFSLILPLTG